MAVCRIQNSSERELSCFMDFIKNFPFFSIVMSLFFAVISSALKPKIGERLAVFSVSLATLFSCSVLFYTIKTGESFTYLMGHFPAPWGNEIRAGILEGLAATVFGCVLLCSVLGGRSRRQADIHEEKTNYYFVMINLIQAALLALVYTNDLFTGYVFIEICTLSSCGLLMIRNVGRTTLATIRYLIFNLLGSGLFLIGISLLYDITGHLLMENIKIEVASIVAHGEYVPPLLLTVSLILIGLAIKSGLFPFHFWMPDTYGYATTTSAAILSGLVSKAYIFLGIKVIFRVIGFDVIASTHILNVLFVFGLAGIIVGSLSAIKENNINRMIAFSSAAQIGYIFVGIGTGTMAGIVAAVFQILVHAVTKPLLFISASSLVDVSGGKRQFSYLQGSAHRNVLAGVAFTVGALSMVGIPMFGGFIAKIEFATAAVGDNKRMIPTIIVLAVSTVLNTIYFFRTVMRIYTPAKDGSGPAVRMKNRLPFILSVVGLSAVNIVLGVCPGPVLDLIEKGLSMFG